MKQDNFIIAKAMFVLTLFVLTVCAVSAQSCRGIVNDGDACSSTEYVAFQFCKEHLNTDQCQMTIEDGTQCIYRSELNSVHCIYHREFVYNELFEVVGTLEDMYEWMQWDVSEGNINKEVGESYLGNLKGTIQLMRSHLYETL